MKQTFPYWKLETTRKTWFSLNSLAYWLTFLLERGRSSFEREDWDLRGETQRCWRGSEEACTSAVEAGDRWLCCIHDIGAQATQVPHSSLCQDQGSPRQLTKFIVQGKSPSALGFLIRSQFCESIYFWILQRILFFISVLYKRYLERACRLGIMCSHGRLRWRLFREH